MKFKNVKLANKLIIGFSGILLITVLIGYVGYSGMNIINSQLTEVSKNRLPSIKSLLILSKSQTLIDAAENALLATNITSEMINNIYLHMDSAKAEADKAWKEYEPLPQTVEEALVWKEFINAWDIWWDHHEIYLEIVKQHHAEMTDKSYKGMSDYALKTIAEPYERSEQLLNQLISINNQIVKETEEISATQSSNAKILLLIIIAIGIFASIILGIVISRAITIPLKKGVNLAKAVAAGNLAISIDIEQEDEIGLLASALRNMVEKLKEITSQISDGINVLGSSAAEILSTVTEISTGAAETATSVSETTTTVEEVRQTALISNQKAQSLLRSSQKVADSVEKGRTAINEVITAMQKINFQMENISNTVIRLSEQSRTIGEITSSVADIADQSNLLAVNAAIEAAKAGEHGRGFSVVAHEIRSLADQSKKATAQVKEILNEINKSVSLAVSVTEQGSRTVEEGSRLVALSGEVIEILAENVEETAQASIQISSSNQQQMAGMEQIFPAMGNIKQASEQNVNGIKQAQAAAHDLNILGQNLKEIIGKFNL